MKLIFALIAAAVAYYMAVNDWPVVSFGHGIRLEALEIAGTLFLMMLAWKLARLAR